MDYQEYLESEWWVSRRQAYYRRYPKVCWVCGSDRRVQLHHLPSGYDNLFGEDDSDLVPLCGGACHEAVHRLIDQGEDPEHAHEVLRERFLAWKLNVYNIHI